ncbi:GyrI-like domain-containing protein [Nonomuraea typhae]|uniref:GyrI-like domain-containing protein n=1 Tax=Nonomuraea typhae TaxID=2603600 RepID=UPI0012FC11DD|nr:GyrI-like domain-containing protein [Nonomuraea typhae]
MTPARTTHGPVTCLSVTGHGPLQGQWRTEDDRPPLTVPRDQWRRHLLLTLPAAPQPGALEHARETTRPTAAAVDRVRLATITEGDCLEMLHEGPYSDEPRTLALMDAYMSEHRLLTNGPHHEIYLTPHDDPSPRTLLRQPVRPAPHP